MAVNIKLWGQHPCNHDMAPPSQVMTVSWGG